jgi:hypothetical protein
MNKAMLATIVGLGLAFAAQAADVEVYLTGATSFRGEEYDTLTQNGLAVVASSSTTGAGGYRGANTNTYSGTWTGSGSLSNKTVIVHASYSGSGAGVGDVANQNSIRFLDTTGNGVLHAPDIGFSDVYQISTPFSTATGSPDISAYDTVVGIIPFVFAGNAAATNKFNNVTGQNFRDLAPSGRIRARFLNGVTNDNTVVYLTGRNNDSGTRVTTFAETAFGISTPCQQYNSVSGTPTAYGANAGASSGSGVASALNDAAETAPFIGYLGINDANTLTGTTGWFLSYNGVPYTANNTVSGKYTFWCYEHCFDANTGNVNVTAFKAPFIAALGVVINNEFTGTTPPAIPLAAMLVTRGGDGALVQ